MKPSFSFPKKISYKKSIKRSIYILLSFFILFFLLNWIFPVPDKIEYSTIITDDNGEVIHAFITKDDKWRMKTELSEISPLLSKAIVAKEDKWFYQHPGINLIAIFHAFFNNIFTGKRTSGASTITMQVAKMLEPKRRTFFNKLKEMFRAEQLELKYSKKEILQLYINLVPYGGNIEGVKSAAVLYLKKNPDHLSLAEITALSIIPNRPNSLRLGLNNNYIIQERNKWLLRFEKENVFNKKEIADAINEPLNISRGAAPQLAQHLSWKCKKSSAKNIHSFLHINTQLKTEELVKDYLQTMAFKNIQNASVIIIDNETHSVISYVGSADFHNTHDGGQVNGAAAIRQPGSTLKPIMYGLCIDAGLMTPKTIMTDVAINYAGYVPENYDQKFNGYVSMEYALDHSLNIPAVKSLKLLGKDKLIQTLAQCGFKQIAKDQNKLGLSMILGGCGCSLEEMTSLFSALANEGEYVSPLYTAADTISQKHVQVLSKASAFMITEILSKINRPDFPMSWTSTIHLPKIAWKTGTSYGRRDAWSIGYNKKYTVGVWLGNFNGSGIPELSGANVATPLLFKIFDTLDYDADHAWYTPPATCQLRLVCSETGLLPNEHCTNIINDYFIPLVSSNAICNNIQEIFVTADEKWSFKKECLPATGYKKKLIKLVPPEMQQYFEDNKIKYEKIPPLSPDCENATAGNAPFINSPINGSDYFIPKQNPEPLALSCQSSADVNKIFWYINNQFYKSCNPKEKLFFMPQAGPIKISCTDDKGRNKDIWIKVKFVDL